LEEKFAAQVILNVCELSDYTSPDDQPDLLQCTVSELESCVIRAFEHFDSERGVPVEMTGWCAECGCGKNDPDGSVVFAHLPLCSQSQKATAQQRGTEP
jgi:hypothetical protein